MQRNSIVRLSLVRCATSFLVVLIVGVLNRVMIVELDIARSIVGVILSVLHLATPLALYFGYLSDKIILFGRRRTPFIAGGMILTAAPVPFLPMLAQALSTTEHTLALMVTGVIMLLIMGFGITISTVAVHALIVDSCPREYRGEAMTLVWIVTLAGYILASPLFAMLMPEYNPDQMTAVFTWSAIAALAATALALAGQEKPADVQSNGNGQTAKTFFALFSALGKVPQARRVFVFIALVDLFFFSQEYVLEAFGKEIHGFTLSQTTSFSMYLGAGMLISMVIVNALYSIVATIHEKLIAGIGLSFLGLSFALLIASITLGLEIIVMPSLLLMGIGKGVYNVGIARTMMQISREDLSGLLMGLWAVVGGIAMGVGELGGAIVVDVASLITASPATGYAILFAIEGFGLIVCVLIIAPFNVKKYFSQLNHRLPNPVPPPDM